MFLYGIFCKKFKEIVCKSRAKYKIQKKIKNIISEINSTHCAGRREAIFVHFFPLHSFNTTIYWKKGGRSKSCVGHPAATTSITKHTFATFFEYCPKLTYLF